MISDYVLVGTWAWVAYRTITVSFFVKIYLYRESNKRKTNPKSAEISSPLSLNSCFTQLAEKGSLSIGSLAGYCLWSSWCPGPGIMKGRDSEMETTRNKCLRIF